MLISINGKISNNKFQEFDLTEGSLNRGFGVFETLRTYNLQIFRLKEHLSRLFHSAFTIGLKSKFGIGDIEKNINEILIKWKELVLNKEARIKIILTENYLIIFFNENNFDIGIYDGVKAISYVGERFLPEIKTLNCLVSHLANSKAKELGCFEAILINRDGYVTEGAYSNVFWITDGVLYTTNEGILDGITRLTVLENYKKYVKDIKFDNKKTIEELKKVDEIFVTQSSKGIIPILSLDGVSIGNHEVGKYTKKLMNIFE